MPKQVNISYAKFMDLFYMQLIKCILFVYLEGINLTSALTVRNKHYSFNFVHSINIADSCQSLRNRSFSLS